jgi:hypothetical protein
VPKVTLDGKVSVLANPLSFADGEPNVRAADLPFLHRLTVDPHGMLYVAASSCGCVVNVTPPGKFGTFLKAEKLWAPSGVTERNGDVYLLEHINPNSDEHESWPPRIRKVGRDGAVTTLVHFATAAPK